MNVFLNDEHYERFIQLKDLLAKAYQNDKEYLAVIFLLAGDKELFKKVSPYFDEKEGIFNFTEMFNKEEFSSSYYTLAKLAVHLFNNEEKITPLELVSNLDQSRYKLAINAIYVRRQGV